MNSETPRNLSRAVQSFFLFEESMIRAINVFVYNCVDRTKPIAVEILDEG